MVRVWILAVLLALLPLRGFAAAGMTVQAAAGAAETAAQAAMPPDCPHHAGGAPAQDDQAACEGCEQCQMCAPAAPAAQATPAPQALPGAAPHAGPPRFASALAPPALKPPIG